MGRLDLRGQGLEAPVLDQVRAAGQARRRRRVVGVQDAYVCEETHAQACISTSLPEAPLEGRRAPRLLHRRLGSRHGTRAMLAAWPSSEKPASRLANRKQREPARRPAGFAP